MYKQQCNTRSQLIIIAKRTFPISVNLSLPLRESVGDLEKGEGDKDVTFLRSWVRSCAFSITSLRMGLHLEASLTSANICLGVDFRDLQPKTWDLRFFS